MKRAAICICNYNKEEMLSQCLLALYEQKCRDFDVYVCDNHSSDGSVGVVEHFARSHSDMEISLIINDTNQGGAGGFNTALLAAIGSGRGYDYLMCVDNDCMLDEGCVGSLINYLDGDPESGMAAAKIYFYDNPALIQCFGLDISYEACGTVSEYFGKIEDGSGPEVRYSDAAPACALMVRSSILEETGLLPEENYIYWDDTTWCCRVRKAGYRIANVAAAKALHGLGQRAETTNTFGTYYAIRNQIRYFLSTTPDEKLKDVAIKILTDIYLEVCGDYESGRIERCQAVMAALDDAIHGVSGKAREGIVRDTSPTETDVFYTSVDALPEQYRAGLEIFIYTNYELFIHGRSLQ